VQHMTAALKANIGLGSRQQVLSTCCCTAAKANWKRFGCLQAVCYCRWTGRSIRQKFQLVPWQQLHVPHALVNACRALTKLFDTLVLPILSYGCEVWGVDTKCAAAAEALHRDFLRRLLGVKKSTANHMVLAELGRFPLQVHFWQQILRYHHRTIALDNVRLVKLAMVDGFALHQTAVKDSWQHYLGDFLHGHVGQQQLFHNFNIASVIERAKHQHAFE